MASTLKRPLRTRLRGLHPATAAGAALLLATLVFDAVVVVPAATRIAALGAAWGRRTASEDANAGDRALPHTPEAKLAAFYAFFRTDSRISDWLARVYDMADRTGVRPHLADYRLVDDGKEPLLRYELTIPLNGDYGRIRAFAEGVLNAIPIASLDHIAFQRQRATQAEVEAELRFTLHMTRPR